MIRRTLGVILIIVGLGAMVFGQTAQEWFNRALIQERAAGDLEGAIQLYQRVAKEAQSDRRLAVQALLAAARAYQKLGQTMRSMSLYQEVARVYPEQREQAAFARAALAETGTVQGRVLRSGSVEPVAGAKVWLSGGPIDPKAFGQLQAFFKSRGVEIGIPPNGIVDDRYLQDLADTASARGVSMANPTVQGEMARFRESNDARFTASTDNLGHFTILDVPAGRYTVRSERDGYFPPPADPSSLNQTTVSSGRTAIVEVSMNRGATVSGRITDASGQPQSRVTVQAYAVQYQAGFPVLRPAASNSTNDQGEYRLFWLPGGEYLVAVTPGLAPGEGGAVSSTAASPAADGGMPSPRTYYPGIADVAQAIPVFIRGESPVSGIDILVKKVPTYQVKGEIRSNVPVSAETTSVQAFFALRPRNTNTPDDFGTPTFPATLRPQGDSFIGEFNIRGVAAGAYDIRAWVPENNPDGGAKLTFAHSEVDVFNQDVTGVALDIYPSVRVNGTLTVDGGLPTMPLRVYMQADGALAKAGVYQGLAARTSLVATQTGAFMVPAVPTGHFRALMGAGMPPDLYVADVRQGGISVFDSGFDVGRDSPISLQIMLKSGARTVEGIIRDASGRPAPNATAVLVPPAERRQNRALYYTAKADGSGHFKIQGVAPGPYSLFSWQNMPEGAYFNERFISRNEDAGRKVNVTQSSMNGADIRQIPPVGQ